jgi:hypothetical protein
MNYAGAKYLPSDLNAHVVAHAVCVSGPAATAEPSVLNPLDVAGPPTAAPVIVPVPSTPAPGGAVPISQGKPRSPYNPVCVIN